MKKNIIFILLTIFLFSCEEEIPRDKLEPYTQKLVVNEYFNNEQPFSIEVSFSTDAYKEAIPEIMGDNKVNVVLTENGTVIPLTFGSGVFSSSVKPQSGKTYNLVVTSPQFGTVNSTSTLPGTILEKNSLFIEDGGTDIQGLTSDLLKLTFRDNANTKDYYKLNFFYYSELIETFNAFDFELTGILSAVNTVKTRDGGFLFSDELFNGELQTFTAVAPFGIVKANTTYKYLIQIQRLSDDFWKYNTSLEQYRGGASGGITGTNLFGGAVVVYSNITNGLGIFAGATVESDTLK